MGNPLKSISWLEKNELMEDLLNQTDTIIIHSMDNGFEAEVMRINLDKASFVLKIWNKNSKPDVSFQYHLLRVLFERGISVSNPVGWGINPNSDKVLLTTFDGMPIVKLNVKKMMAIAHLLSNIHKISIEKIEDLQLPKYDFTDYFYPGIREHLDLYHALNHLLGVTQIIQDRIIHGDFHILNIVEANEQYTAIDWTNAQLGDSRYDFAWSLALLRIYISERYASIFRSVYLTDNSISPEEMEIFEAMACLRWILLNRSNGLPKGPTTMSKLKSLIKNNIFLKEFEFSDISIKRKG